MRQTTSLWVLCLVVLTIAPTFAQDAGIGTGLLTSPNALGKGATRIELDWRHFDGGNNTIGGAVEYGLSDRLDIGVSYVDFGNTSLIAGVARNSSLDGPGVRVRWVGREVEEGSFGWALIPGVEFLDMSSRVGGTVAGADEQALTLEVPIGIPDGDALWIVAPRLVDYPDFMTASIGPPIRHFGTIVGLGLGIVAPIGGSDWSVWGDMTPIIEGENSVDPTTGLPAVQLPWSIGVRWAGDLLTDDTNISIYATNTSGATPATSIIATPGSDLGFGAAVSVGF